MNLNKYQLNGYHDRRDYLASLAEEWGLEFQEVLDAALLLGQEEDFDALPMVISDIAEIRQSNFPFTLLPGADNED